MDTVNRNVSFDVQAQLSVTETRIKWYSTSRIGLVFFLLQRYRYFMQQSCCNSVLFPANSFGNLLLYDFEFIYDGKGENNNKKRGICLSLSSKKMESINFKKDFQPKEEGKLTLRKVSTRFWILVERSTSWMIDFWLVFYRGSLSKYVLKAGIWF